MRGRALRSRVTPRALSRPDRAGDPLDGLVNLFDLGIVLAVAFLLAALSSLKLSDLLTNKDVTVLRSTPNGGAVIVKRGAQVKELQLSGERVVGQGEKVGSVYRLSDGREVYVKDGDVATSSGAATGATGASGPTGPTGSAGATGGAGSIAPPPDTSTSTTPGGTAGATTPSTPGSATTPGSAGTSTSTTSTTGSGGGSSGTTTSTTPPATGTSASTGGTTTPGD